MYEELLPRNDYSGTTTKGLTEGREIQLTVVKVTAAADKANGQRISVLQKYDG